MALRVGTCLPQATGVFAHNKDNTLKKSGLITTPDSHIHTPMSQVPDRHFIPILNDPKSTTIDASICRAILLGAYTLLPIPRHA